jgi:phosphoglycerate dehydrogenase-like enzyme
MSRKIVYPDAEDSLISLFTGSRLDTLDQLGEFKIHYGATPDDATCIARCAGAQAIISGWGMNNRVLAALPDVEVISFAGLGVSTFIDLAEAARRNITVTHTISAAHTIAEHTMGMMLDTARHITRLDRDMRQGNWNMDITGSELRGRTLGLVGFGRIAAAVAPLAQAFGMNVISWTRNPGSDRATQYGVEFVELDDLLATSDVVSLHLSATPETQRLLDAKRLRSMKPGVLLINTARSSLLDETALVELLRSGHVGAAGIDVFDHEPVSPSHPFLELDNVVLTPHVAYNTPEALVEMYDTAIENLVAYYAGKPQNIATGPKL